ncbi:MAG: DMT family transporter [Candidatus Aenigmarchaeota archaeon]|nr:DMT family transporter [Candidatus Aenigmarchaeota archaeon]
MKKEQLGTLFALITAIISGIAIPANKLFVVKIDPLVFTSIRSIIIGAIFLLISLTRNEFNKRKNKIDWKNLLAIAIIGGAFAFYLYFSGLKLTTSGRAAFLHKTLPLYVCVLAFIFLKEKIDKKLLLAITLMFFGTVILYLGQIKPAEMWQNPSLGDLLVIIATFLWGIENIIARKVMREGESNFIVSFSRMFFGGLILFGLLIISNKLNQISSLTTDQIRNILISTTILFCYVFFWYKSVKLINVSKASTFLLISPVISLLIGILAFNEPYNSLQLVGSALILLGSYFAAKTKSELMSRL